MNEENLKRIKELAKAMRNPELIERLNFLDEILDDGIERVWEGSESILWNFNGPQIPK